VFLGGGGWSVYAHLLHVSVVQRVVRHLVQLQFDDLFELVAVAFPLADDDHFVEQEYIPEDTHTHTHSCLLSAPGYFYSSCLFFFNFFGLTGPVSSGWRWSTPSALRLSLASRTPPVSPAASVTRAHTQRQSTAYHNSTRLNERTWIIHSNFRENAKKKSISNKRLGNIFSWFSVFFIHILTRWNLTSTERWYKETALFGIWLEVDECNEHHLFFVLMLSETRRFIGHILFAEGHDRWHRYDDARVPSRGERALWCSVTNHTDTLWILDCSLVITLVPAY